MNIFRHRPLGLPALTLLLAVAGCSAADDSPAVAAPRPDAKTAGMCRNLHQELPGTLDGQRRDDPAPRSAYTAAWGSPAIILRCGVERPARMRDPEADGVEVNGVGWLLVKRDDGSFRFTTTLRAAYVEVTLPKERTAHGLTPLIGLAEPIKKAIPEGIARSH
ncbi:DUF3515 domain-containing protein [Streptomyces sp. V3I7]|uniref:DUF3515 domain-containing protein n=1 Tax=Streptomyces sp. V3I7 TaxID=3042278 RepID=UPI00278A0F1F|nr:DUF3515 domain-containing protein [Streptomyces sp. V3I7]MDQ0993262.1 hypothetical protein [Streptomyces sp. V3I7]